MLGGLLIGLIEAFWSGYFSVEYKDVSVFVILVLVLVFRPSSAFASRRSAVSKPWPNWKLMRGKLAVLGCCQKNPSGSFLSRLVRALPPKAFSD
jgi:hypothetical protein